MSSATRTYPQKKLDYAQRLNDLLSKFKTLLVVEADNVQSAQMHAVRLALRGKGEVVMGKNTLIRKVMRLRYEKDASEANEALYDSFVTSSGTLTGNVGLVLTNSPVEEIVDILQKFRVDASARVGAIAPVSVTIPGGKTGLEPTQTTFFMTLGIQTKIEGGQITILKDVVAVKAGEKVGPSEAKLLLKMNLKPFRYGLETKFIYEDGVLFPKSCVGLSDSVLDSIAQGAVDDIAALSLATGVQSAPALSHQVLSVFTDILSFAFGTDTTFSDFGADTFIKNVKEGKVSAAPAAAAAGGKAAAAAPAAEAAAAPAAEEEDVDFGDALF